MATVPIEFGFWFYVAIADDSDSCWPWLGNRHSYGYGKFGHNGLGAHRIAWELSFGPIENGLFVCHHCDNPPCCNPVHLFLGTHKQNISDAAAKGRMMRGEKHYAAKLTLEQVLEIRKVKKKYGVQVELARKYGVPRQLIRRVLDRERWAWLGKAE